MQDLLNKLNYKGHKRIVVINASENFLKSISEALNDVIIDTEVDQRCPYEFMILFVKSVDEVELYAPVVLHNLVADGVLWFCYPKKSSKKYSSDIDRDHGWEALNKAGFQGIRMVAVDDDWSAMRFRNAKYIKSASGKFEK